MMRGNNEEVVEDHIEAYGDCTGAARLYRHQRGCVGELELAMMCVRLQRSL